MFTTEITKNFEIENKITHLLCLRVKSNEKDIKYFIVKNPSSQTRTNTHYLKKYSTPDLKIGLPYSQPSNPGPTFAGGTLKSGGSGGPTPVMSLTFKALTFRFMLYEEVLPKACMAKKSSC